MKKILSLLLVLTIIISTVGCRGNVTQESANSTPFNDEINESIPDNYDHLTESVVCSHNNTTIINRSDATCVTNGYTGDIYCTDCNAIVTIGSPILSAGHDVEIRNRQDATPSLQGYSGDSFCKVCGVMTAVGEVIPKLEETVPVGKVKYTSDNGYVYIVDEGVNITEYSMKQQTKYIESKYRNIELEILDLCNKERAKLGIAPLTWCEDAYYFTHIRSGEIFHNWDHKRPNGSAWHTVYTDADVILNAAAENLAQQVGSINIAAGTVEAWMNSTSGHRESILNPDFTKMAVAISYNENTFVLCVAQHFFN